MTNTMFPGRSDYTGPISGIFGLLHHEILYETSHDVFERVAYVKKNKPTHEIPIRLHNMIYLGGCEAAAKRGTLYADYKAKRAPLEADYEAKRGTLEVDYEAKCAPLDAEYEAKRSTLYADYRAKCATLDAAYYGTKRDTLYADYEAKRVALWVDYEAKCAPLDADYEAKHVALEAEILAYIKAHIPDCAWDGETLVFSGYSK